MAVVINVEVDNQWHMFHMLIIEYGRSDPGCNAWGVFLREGSNHNHFYLKLPTDKVTYDTVTGRHLFWYAARSARDNPGHRMTWDSITSLDPAKVMAALSTAKETGVIYNSEWAKITYGQDRNPSTIIRERNPKKRKKQVDRGPTLPGLFDDEESDASDQTA